MLHRLRVAVRAATPKRGRQDSVPAKLAIVRHILRPYWFVRGSRFATMRRASHRLRSRVVQACLFCPLWSLCPLRFIPLEAHMRADRLLSILLHLQVHRRITAGELARRLEVSERTIYRDMVALGMAGIPVVAERGVHGGWMLMEEYRTNLTGLNEAEIQALFLAKPTRLLADLNLDKAAEGALVKLLAALPTMHRRGAQDVRQRIHIDVLGWRQTREALPLLPPLQEAVWQERRVRMTYRRGDGEVVERVIEPLGLVAKGSIWYLIASAEGEGEPRTYRISRVLG